MSEAKSHRRSRTAEAFALGNGFTLVELLVVISIIALLIAMLMPSLNRARLSAQSVQCMSNLRQCVLAQIQYANDNRGWSAPMDITYPASTGGATWHQILAMGKYLPTPHAGQPTVFVCPTQTPSVYEIGGPGVALRHTYGCRLAYTPFGFEFAPFSITSTRVKNKGEQVKAVDWGSPSRFILVMDSVSDEAPFPTDYRKQIYAFWTIGLANNGGHVHTRHLHRANAAFGDGHCESLSRDQLLGNYGSADGTTVPGFDTIAIDVQAPG